MNRWENMEEISCTFNATSDFTDWLNELKVNSIADLDVVGLHDKTTGERREFIAVDKVLELLDDCKIARPSNFTFAWNDNLERVERKIKAFVERR